jgi:hypothetical protein
MANPELSELLGLILAAGGPERQLVRVRWPLHLALGELHERTGRRGERGLLGVELQLRGSAEVGQEVIGADSALQTLVRGGTLRAEGELQTAQLVLDENAAVRWRRALMALPPAKVVVLQRVGTRWAALASTAAKNRSTASRSLTGTVSSARPNRAKLAALDAAW